MQAWWWAEGLADVEMALMTQETVLSNLLDLERERAREFADDSRSANTVRAYASDLRHFCAWAGERGLLCLPASAETVSVYISSLASQVRPATIRRRLAAISAWHTTAGYPNPCEHGVVRAVHRSVRRKLGVAQSQKDALGVGDLGRMVAAADGGRVVVGNEGGGLKGVRDRALLLLGFAAALRRSELVALDVADLQFVEGKGVVLTLKRSKTDQEGASATVAVKYARNPAMCPVSAVQAWLRESHITDGPVFRPVDIRGVMAADRLSDKAVSLVIKALAKRTGLDPTRFSGHSLRAGFATEAARNGASESSIMRQTRHRSVQVARRYIRQGTQWQNHAGDGLL